MKDLKETPLFEEHVRLGGKIIPFAGYAMPVQYPTGIRAEHQAVRETAGLFDVSHMGEFRVRGADALAFVSYATTNDPSLLEEGDAQYSALCHESGGVIDDLIVYRMGEGDYRLVVNAANLAKDWTHLAELAEGFDVELTDESDEVALLALQGPRAEGILVNLTDARLDDIGYYRFVEGKVFGAPCVISRTGYTGESGFELYLPSRDAVRVWRKLIAGGRGAGGPRRAGLAPPRGGVRALRQRHRRRDDGLGGRARLAGQTGQGATSWARPRSRRSARPGSPASCASCACWSAASRARGTRCASKASRWGRCGVAP